MAKKKVADLLLEVLAEAGVRQIDGVPSDSLNGITDLIRKRQQIQCIHLRPEETAAFAAGAQAHLAGRLAVCAGSCGPGNLHLINSLYDCHRSRAPVLAIAMRSVFVSRGPSVCPCRSESLVCTRSHLPIVTFFEISSARPRAIVRTPTVSTCRWCDTRRTSSRTSRPSPV